MHQLLTEVFKAVVKAYVEQACLNILWRCHTVRQVKFGHVFVDVMCF